MIRHALFLACALAVLALPARAADPQALIADAIAAHWPGRLGDTGTLAVHFSTAVPADAVAVSTILWDPRTGGFDAVLDLGRRLMRVQGVAQMEMEIPVPARRILAGETIGTGDLTSMRAPVARLDDAVADPALAVGKEARRALAAGRAIPAASLSEPMVVRRNQEVLVAYEKGGLAIMARGKALGDAPLGAPVRVSLPGGGAAIETVVTAEGRVSVAP